MRSFGPDADDICQDACERLIERRHSISDHLNPRAYASMTLHSCICNFVRRRGRYNKRLQLFESWLAEHGHPDDVLHARDVIGRIQELEFLADEFWNYVDAIMHGAEAKAVADELGVEHGTMRVRISRQRAKLRKAVAHVLS